MQAFIDNQPTTAGRPTGFVLLVALLALMGASKAIHYDTIDPDCFWHLRVAQQLHRDGIRPLVDEISFASLKEPWAPYSWLAELGMNWLWERFGWRSAVAAHALLTSAIIIFVALACRERARVPRGEPSTDGDLPSALATAFAMYWILPYVSFRPVAAAFVFIALSAWLLMRDHRLDERSRTVWCIPLAAALCTNIHFFALLIPAMVACEWVGVMPGTNPSARRCRGRYLLLTALTLVGAVATPMLPGMLLSLLHYQFRDPTLSASFVTEFRPFYQGPAGAASAMMLAGFVVWIAVKRRHLRFAEVAWAILGIVLLLRLGRFAPVFAVLSAPALVATLPRWRGAALHRRPVRLALAAVLGLGAVRLVVAFPPADASLDAWLNRHGSESRGYPTAAAEFVEAHVPPRTGRLVNEFSWGGYLAWRFGNRFTILIDGRTQLYPPAMWQAMYSNDTNGLLDEVLSRGADVAILPRRNSRLRDGLVRRGWHSVYCDERAEVLLPTGSAIVDVSN